MERWLPVKDHPSYEISDQGRVKSLARQITKGYENRAVQNHAETILNCCFIGCQLRFASYDGGDRLHAVGRTVWEHFVGPIPPKHVVRFRDGNNRNCALPNLLLLSRADLLRWNSGRELVDGAIYPPTEVQARIA